MNGAQEYSEQDYAQGDDIYGQEADYGDEAGAEGGNTNALVSTCDASCGLS